MARRADAAHSRRPVRPGVDAGADGVQRRAEPDDQRGRADVGGAHWAVNFEGHFVVMSLPTKRPPSSSPGHEHLAALAERIGDGAAVDHRDLGGARSGP